MCGEAFRVATRHRQNNSDNQSKEDGKDQESNQVRVLMCVFAVVPTAEPVALLLWAFV